MPRIKHPHTGRQMGGSREDRTPKPEPAPNESAANKFRLDRAASALPGATNTMPTGLPDDPHEILAVLHSGNVSAEAVRYLHNATALAGYENGLNAAAGKLGVEHPDVILGQKILAAWKEWLADHPAPPAGNPFNPGA